MEFEKEVNYVGLEEKKIGKGERAGQSFYILKLIYLNDPYEVTIFDNPTLVQKFLNMQRFQEMLCRFKVSQKNGELKLHILDVLA